MNERKGDTKRGGYTRHNGLKSLVFNTGFRFRASGDVVQKGRSWGQGKCGDVEGFGFRPCRMRRDASQQREWCVMLRVARPVGASTTMPERYYNSNLNYQCL